MQPKLDDLYKQGIEAFDKDDYEKAEPMFREILRESPHFADIQNKLGIIYHQTNRLELAAKSFEKALSINPGYTEASLNLSITYSDQHKYEKAREVFEQAAHFVDQNQKGKAATAGPGIDPFIKGKLADEHRRLGNMYYDLGLLDEAIEEYQKALRLSPNFADIITYLGVAFRDKGMFDDAIMSSAGPSSTIRSTPPRACTSASPITPRVFTALPKRSGGKLLCSIPTIPLFGRT